jgi:transcriptional regulator with XRE-family HTH domain
MTKIKPATRQTKPDGDLRSDAGATAPRITLLRDRLNLTRTQLSRRSGTLSLPEISHLESGRNKGSTLRVRRALAAGFGVPVDALNAYLEGAMSLAEIVASATDKAAPNDHLEAVLTLFRGERGWSPATIEAVRHLHAERPLNAEAWIDLLDAVEIALQKVVRGRGLVLIRRTPETEWHREEERRHSQRENERR